MEITPSRLRVMIRHDGEILADSSRALLVRGSDETPVYYLPRADVRMEVLVQLTEAIRTEAIRRPLQGVASYWKLKGDGQSLPAAWSYETAPDHAEAIEGYMAFDLSVVEIDGSLPSLGENPSGRLFP